MDTKKQSITRRSFLKGTALLATIAVTPALVMSEEAAAAKLAKPAMQYQDTPKGTQDCVKCIQFVPGKTAKADGTCKVVEGSISPKGWCVAYAPKA